MPRNRLVRLFWMGAAALLVVAALVALAALLRGRFTETDGRILLTLGALFLAGSVGIAGIALVERRALAWLGRATVGSAPVWFALMATAIWSESLEKWAGTAVVLLVAELVLTTNVLMLRDRRFRPLVAATAVALGLTTSLFLVVVWTETDSSGLARAVGTSAILTGLGYFLTPVLQRWSAVGEGTADLRVLAALGDVELVASREQVEGVVVTAKPAAGERLFLRRRQPGS